MSPETTPHKTTPSIPEGTRQEIINKIQKEPELFKKLYQELKLLIATGQRFNAAVNQLRKDNKILLKEKDISLIILTLAMKLLEDIEDLGQDIDSIIGVTRQDVAKGTAIPHPIKSTSSTISSRSINPDDFPVDKTG
jgi:hypothetical protein